VIRIKVLVVCDHCKVEADGYVEQRVAESIAFMTGGEPQTLFTSPGWRVCIGRTYCSASCQIMAETK
jgi:hypothetical protein